jgi:hypothetical protein
VTRKSRQITGEEVVSRNAAESGDYTRSGGVQKIKSGAISHLTELRHLLSCSID